MFKKVIRQVVSEILVSKLECLFRRFILLLLDFFMFISILFLVGPKFSELLELSKELYIDIRRVSLKDG